MSARLKISDGTWRLGKQPQNWLTARQATYLAAFFDDTCYKVSARLSRDPSVHEVTLTDDFADEFRPDTDKHNRIMSALEAEDIHLELEVTRMTLPEETEVGADVGIVLDIRMNDLSLKKAILLQAKKLAIRGNEPEYRDLLTRHARMQSKKMLAATPASFFMLYNPLPFEPANEGVNFIEFPEAHRTRVNLFPPEIRQGIMILPAITQQGLKVKPGFQTISRFSLPFTNFMLDDFIQCKVGDGGSKAIRIASSEEEKFPVRHTIKLVVYTAD
jgi:hypothetical protein